ncbi:50S ribosomal protein L18 [Haliscomenobacter sp.]|jgi:large subunit ribosomal protein L18|uniref:50S ribosomal protein L18 n=1 Tax=Haliscomenobacter sp. TaxID=2717303 RepID=UPI003364B928
MQLTKANRRRRIHNRVRKKITGTPARPRLAVYRSNKAIYAQIIDDLAGHTLVSASSMEEAVVKSVNKTEQAKAVGKILAERAVQAKIGAVVFDRGGYLYHGRVKALADGAREAGLSF